MVKINDWYEEQLQLLKQQWEAQEDLLNNVSWSVNCSNIGQFKFWLYAFRGLRAKRMPDLQYSTWEYVVHCEMRFSVTKVVYKKAGSGRVEKCAHRLNFYNLLKTVKELLLDLFARLKSTRYILYKPTVGQLCVLIVVTTRKTAEKRSVFVKI